MRASASTLAAPPMSFFMISMPLDGLRSSPPVSKQTPLPTSVTLGWSGSPQAMSISRGARSEAMPTAWISGKFVFEILADGAGEARAEFRGERLRGRGELFRAHVVGRRVDEVARQHRGIRHAIDLGRVDAVGRYQPDGGAVSLAVAGEAVAAERKGERRQPRIVRGIGKAIDARRQQAGQGARPEQVARSRALVLESEQHLRDRAVRARAARDSRPAWRQRRSRWRTGAAPAAISRRPDPSSTW